MRGRTIAAVVALLWANPAQADSTPTTESPAGSKDAVAFALYEKASQELEAGQYDLAAKHFARADAVSPTPAALEAALVAVLKTDDAVLGMTLASRAQREPFHERIGELADAARDRFGDRVGRLRIECSGCVADVDGVRADTGVVSWHPVGPHQVTMTTGERIDEQRVTVKAGTIALVEPTDDRLPEPQPPRVVASDTSSGISPAFFWIGVGVTAAAGAATIVSFVDLKGIHDDFQQTPSAALADEGDAAQMRTRVLLGVTGGLAVATTLVGALAVDWGGDDAPEMSVVTDGRTIGMRMRW